MFATPFLDLPPLVGAAGSLREQGIAHHRDCALCQQAVAALGHHDRIEHHVDGFPVCEPVCNRGGDLGAAEHADLGRVQLYI